MGFFDGAGTGIFSFLGALGSSVGNYFSTKNTNKTNQEINQSQLDYARSTTLEQWERDDNAHQREVKDLEAAGLSPLANTSGSQVTSANSPSGMIAMQAPQLDTNAIVNAIASGIRSDQNQQQIDEQIRHNKELEGFRDTELSNQAKQIENESKRIELENKKVQQEIEYQSGLLKVQADELNEKSRSAKENENLRFKELRMKEIEEESKRFYQEVLKQSGGRDIPYKEINDINLYKYALKQYMKSYQIFIAKIGATQSSAAISSSSSKNNSGSGGLSAGASGLNGSPLGLNVGIQGSGSSGSSKSQSEYKSENLSKKQEEMLAKWQKENPIPIYIDLKKYKYHSQKEY